MCTMENETKKKNFHRNFLSNSYLDGIERVVGVNGHMNYEIPPATIKKRQLFWDNFFLKYSEQLSDDIELDIETLKPCSSTYKSGIVCKPKGVVQYWVNTGYLPYQPSVNKNSYLKNNFPSLEEINMNYTRGYCDENSLSSSVDTVAYILSNVNTTNKAERMAIVEGAKHDDVTNFCNTMHCENTEVAQVANDKIYENNINNDISNNNTSNFQQYSPVTSKIMTCTLQHKNTDVQENMNTLNQTFNMRSSLVDSCKSYSYKLPNRISTPVHSKQSYLERSLLDSNTIKMGHRKKLYSGRDSPVDLVTMNQSNKRGLCKLTHRLHPALDFQYPLQKKIKVPRKKKFKHYIIDKSLTNALSPPDCTKSDEIENSKNYSNKLSLQLNNLEKSDDTLRANDETLNNPNNIQDLNECNSAEPTNMSSSNQLVNVNCKPDFKKKTWKRKVTKSEKINSRLSNKSNNTSKELKNLNSTNQFTKLSKVDSQRHVKKTNKIEKDPSNLNAVVALTRLSNLDIQKYKKLKNYLHNLHPVVRLKKLSESEIQKYKRPTDMTKDAKYLNAVVRLTRLSEATIKRYKKVLNTSVRSKCDTVLLPHRNVNGTQLPLKTTSNCIQCPLNIINVVSNDTDSDISTLLVYKCGSKTLSATMSDISGMSDNTAEFHPPIVKACNNTTSKTCETNKALIVGKDVVDKQSTDKTLNMSIDSNKHVGDTSSYHESEMPKNRCSDNVHTTGDRKMKSYFNSQLFNMDNELINPRHCRRSKEKLNVAEEKNRSGYNNSIEAGIHNTTEKDKSGKGTVIESPTGKGQKKGSTVFHDVKNKKDNKQCINYLHFETKLYDSSDSDVTTDFDILF